MSEWIEWQREYLLDSYNEKTNKEISEFLGNKSEQAVAQKLSSMEIKRDINYLSEARSSKKRALKVLFTDWDKLFCPPLKI